MLLLLVAALASGLACAGPVELVPLDRSLLAEADVLGASSLAPSPSVELGLFDKGSLCMSPDTTVEFERPPEAGVDRSPGLGGEALVSVEAMGVVALAVEPGSWSIL